jgi:aminoglycoside N3'-acetyltransferase
MKIMLNSIKYKLKNTFLLRRINSFTKIENPELNKLSSVISNFSNDNCSVLIGLRSFKKLKGTDNVMDNIVQLLDTSFKNIITPAYTPSFKKSGIFHALFTKPDSIGAFAVNFQKYANYRSFDPLHSYWVRGLLDPNQFDNRESFSDNSFAAQLNSKNTTSINIGTTDFRSANIHQLEQHFNVPYRKKVTYKGIIYYDEKKHEEIEQITTENIGSSYIDFPKIEYDMLKNGLLKRYAFGDLIVRIWNNAEYFDFMQEKIKENPNYRII